jgi:hypothetical protein
MELMAFMDRHVLFGTGTLPRCLTPIGTRILNDYDPSSVQYYRLWQWHPCNSRTSQWGCSVLTTHHQAPKSPTPYGLGRLSHC